MPTGSRNLLDLLVEAAKHILIHLSQPLFFIRIIAEMRIILPAVSDRKLFGFMIVGAYILSLGTLAFVPIPEVNSEYFGQLMMGLVGAVGIIVGAIWKTTASEERTQQVERETMRSLVDKVPPAMDAAAASTPAPPAAD